MHSFLIFSSFTEIFADAGSEFSINSGYSPSGYVTLIELVIKTYALPYLFGMEQRDEIGTAYEEKFNHDDL